MTSSLSSVKAFRTLFLQSLRKLSVHAVALFLLLLPMFADLLSMFRQLYSQNYYGYSDNDIYRYAYVLNRYGGIAEMGYVCLAVGLSAMFLALHCWRYLHVKKTVNVYFSLGVSRATQFSARSLAGILLLTAPVVLVFALLFCGNVYLFGYSSVLLQATVFYALSLLAIALFAFAVTSFSMCLSGASLESFVCAGCLIALPVTLFYACKYLSMLFLDGACFDIAIRSIATGEIIDTATFAPGHTFLNFFEPVASADFTDGFYWLKGEEWVGLDFSYPLFWLAMAAVMFVAAFLAYRFRKAEKAAFLGKNPLLVAFACLPFAYLLGVWWSLVYSDLELSPYLVFASAALLFLFWLAVMAVLLRNRKKLLRALPAGIAVSALFLLTCVCISTDVIGYENRIPEKQDISDVTISTALLSMQNSEGFSESGLSKYEYWNDSQTPIVYTAEDIFIHSLAYTGYISLHAFSELNREQDIDFVLSVHEEILQAEQDEKLHFRYPVYLSYVCKDGSIVSRYYTSIPASLVPKLDGYFAQQQGSEMFSSAMHQFYYDAPALIAPAASRVTLLAAADLMQEAFFKALPAALAADMEAGTLPVSPVGKEAPLGYISLNTNVYFESYEEPLYYTGDGSATQVYEETTQVYEETTQVTKMRRRCTKKRRSLSLHRIGKMCM